jgi:hypothetical protein
MDAFKEKKTDATPLLSVKDKLQNKDVRELFFSIFLFQEENTIIPELYSFLKEDVFIDFIFLFGGMHIKIPSLSYFNNLLIYCTIKVDVLRGADLKEVLKKYNVTQTYYNRLCNMFEKHFKDNTNEALGDLFNSNSNKESPTNEQ